MMRLSIHYQTIIKQQAARFFGDDVSVYLFGSRTDSARKGGDIDLCIAAGQQQGLLKKKAKFLAALDRTLGEQKIDVVIYRDGIREIERTALETGILL